MNTLRRKNATLPGNTRKKLYDNVIKKKNNQHKMLNFQLLGGLGERFWGTGSVLFDRYTNFHHLLPIYLTDCGESGPQMYL